MRRGFLLDSAHPRHGFTALTECQPLQSLLGPDKAILDLEQMLQLSGGFLQISGAEGDQGFGVTRLHLGLQLIFAYPASQRVASGLGS